MLWNCGEGGCIVQSLHLRAFKAADWHASRPVMSLRNFKHST